MCKILILLFAVQSCTYGDITAQFLDALEGEDMREIAMASNLLERKINSISHEDKINLAKVLYKYKDDKRPSVDLSYDESSGSVRGHVLASMSRLTNYNSVLNPKSENPDNNPFHLLNPFVEEDFLRWFEKNYLSDGLNSNTQRSE